MRLGAEAQRIMDELRDEAAKIRVGLEAEKLEEEQVAGRKIAQAKGKAGRFSAVHMAQFKKMDSIENHPSVLRYQASRLTPLKAGVKRSQSSANMDEPETARPRQPAPASHATKTRSRAVEEPMAAVKRPRQNMDDDASSKRPISRDGSSIPMPKSAGPGIPRSKSNLAALMTPTKSSLARADTVKVKTPAQGSLIRSPSKVTVSGIPRSATTSNLPTASLSAAKEATHTTADARTPGSRFERVKAMLRGARASASKPKSALPMPSALGSKTPAPVRLEKDLPPVPMTTPGRKLTKRVAFTPETQQAALTQNSPSPIKSTIPRAAKPRQVLGEVYYPSLDGVLAEQKAAEDGVSYPDLSARRPLPELSLIHI